MLTAIIIPCYNEANRFPLNRYLSFLKFKHKVILYFINDGSTDQTFDVLSKLKKLANDKIQIVSLTKNQGKAEAVRSGMLEAQRNKDIYCFAYLDADLSTSLEECLRLADRIDSQKELVFGSRIKKNDNNIRVKNSRFIIGRIIAAFISMMLKISVYDTQCGCKIFTLKWSKMVFKDPFLTSWLFDVEIFYRLINKFGRKSILNKIEEVPLKEWINVDDSKVSLSYGFKVWFDILKIYRYYD